MDKIIKYSLLFCLILATLLNINWLNSFILGIITSFLYFIVFGFLLGQYIFAKQKTLFKLIIGSFSLLAVYSLIGAIIYYFYQLNLVVVDILFILISGLIIYLNFKHTQELHIKIKIPKFTLNNIILIVSYLILFFISLYILWQAQTTEAINSPWQVIPSSFIIIYFIASINLLLLLIKNKNIVSTILVSFHFFLTTSIALIIYKLGYGFDPFIHQATEQTIFQQGFILPKPFYYLGQYSLVIILSHLVQLSTELIDKLLLPVILSIFLPYTIYQSLYSSFKWPKKICRILTLSFLMLPFGLFLVTTPQALANIFIIITLFLSFLYFKQKIPFYYLIILGLSSLFIHALAGLPIIIYLIITKLIASQFKFKNLILIAFSILSSLILPLALIFNSFISIYKVQINQINLNLIKLPEILHKQFNYFLDIAYLYQYLVYGILFTIALIVFFYLLKQKKLKIFLGTYLLFIILITNSILLKFIKLAYIIDYEQLEFSSRIFQISFYFLLPPIIYAFYILLSIALQIRTYRCFILFIIPLILTCSIYLSYPRYDDYDNSKFINISQDDFDIVNFIDKESQTQYIVLANQMTSAAALKTFGFVNYYNNHYFYPIPTGGQLYSYFEKMLYQSPNKETILEAMNITGVATAYFILPQDWHQAEIIIEKAKKEADKIYQLNEKYYIFKYIN
ncbi:hypothetical protein ACFL2U_01885 [Patescibacteria group bacterium]